jgi:hypothetical protein
MNVVSRWRRCDRGGVAMASAIVAPVLALIVGATVELSRVRGLGSELQDSVDAAALHAAKISAEGGTAAQTAAAAKSFVAASLRDRAATSAPSVNTVITTRPARVRVEAQSTLSLVFGGVLGASEREVTRVAVAEARLEPICILLLERTAAQAWSAGGSSRVEGAGCSAQVNSTSSTALQSNGGAGATMKAIHTAGTVQNTGGFRPQPVPLQPALSDPIAPRVSWPATAPCPGANNNTRVNAPKTLQPGVYCNGIDIGNGGVATLNPGVYVLQSGNVSIANGGRLLARSGVTLVLTGPTSRIDITSGGMADVRGPTSGPWRGIAIAVKPQASELTSNMQGGGELLFDGIIYLPSQRLHLTGGGDASVAGLRRIFVARRLETSGNGKVIVNGDPTLLAETARMRLVE